ncbi:acyl-homoserine-lactone synthase [Brenneria rubrifaciens]|uniref:Acyl-homoserine-lactone synthase n=1 Tax=Brenneria rubrifaciens TaxID=55213 RepID=D0PSW1_9GAMM|nr:acyl-homoserine-lactone synthase [Brenneria rubrifaciens]ACJ12917.1 autoinducer synthetase [Brenneria rubrifaciens]QCR09044.1 acyl-homoserine-lactone synthase [Brenneria rubrifaciens]
MLEIFDVSFNLISNKEIDELFTLRKETFKDRLNWSVNCINGMEFDEYDGENTNYILGVKNKTIVCSVRMIEMKYPNMITGTFFNYFNEIKIPEGNYIESSRFFVDRERARALIGNNNPVCLMLFLSMINYARNYHYDGIYTIVSRSMLTILKRSGWRLSVVGEGLSEKNENIYLLFLPIDCASQHALIERIVKSKKTEPESFENWPLVFPIKKEEA